MDDSDGSERVPADIPPFVVRSLAGEATPEERRELERWLAGAPERRERLAELRWLWDASGALPAPQRMDRLWRGLARAMHAGARPAAMQAEPPATERPAVERPAGERPAGERPAGERPAAERVAAPEGGSGPERPTLRLVRGSDAMTPAVSPAPPARPAAPRRPPAAAPSRAPARRTAPRRWVRDLASAAAAVLLFVGGTVVYRGQRAPPAVELDREYATVRGQRAPVELPDGTRIELAAATELRVRYVRGGARLVYLEGEAFFDVAHDPRRPFVVHSAHGIVEDLGTRFAVRALPTDTVVQVAVVSGIVAFGPATGAPASRTVLGAGQAARLDRTGFVETLSEVAASAALGWTRNRVAFRQATLREVADAVGRSHDVWVAIPDSALARQRITLDVPSTTVDEILGAAAAPLGARLRRAADGTLQIVAGAGEPARDGEPARR